jgi:hypothetical protein
MYIPSTRSIFVVNLVIFKEKLSEISFVSHGRRKLGRSDKKTPEKNIFSFFRGDNRIVQAGLPDPTEEVFRRFTGNKPVSFYL